MHHSAQESASRERDTILLLASEKVTRCNRRKLPSDGQTFPNPVNVEEEHPRC